MATVTTEAGGAAHDIHLPFYMTPVGETDVLFAIVVVFVIGLIFLIGLFYFKLHALPEQLAHDSAQFQVVAILALLALFTHNNLFWIAALLLAAIRLPDFISPMTSVAASLKRLADAADAPPPVIPDAAFPAPPSTEGAPAEGPAPAPRGPEG